MSYQITSPPLIHLILWQLEWSHCLVPPVLDKDEHREGSTESNCGANDVDTEVEERNEHHGHQVTRFSPRWWDLCQQCPGKKKRLYRLTGFMSIATCLFVSFSLLPPSCSWGAARRQERRGSRWERKDNVLKNLLHLSYNLPKEKEGNGRWVDIFNVVFL